MPEYIQILREQAKALRRGDNPPPLYTENRNGPFRLNSPKEAKTNRVTVVDPPGNAIYIPK